VDSHEKGDESLDDSVATAYSTLSVVIGKGESEYENK